MKKMLLMPLIFLSIGNKIVAASENNANSNYLALEAIEEKKQPIGTKRAPLAWSAKKWKNTSISHTDGKRYRVYEVANQAEATGTKVCVAKDLKTGTYPAAPQGVFGRSWHENRRMNRCYYLPNDIKNPTKGAKLVTTTQPAPVKAVTPAPLKK